MKKAAPQMKHPTTTLAKKKTPVKKIVKEPLAEGYILEPHADYGILNEDLDKEPGKK